MNGTNQNKPILAFHLGERYLAIPLSHVREILPMAALESPPGLPFTIEGFLNLGGKLVPVLRLEALFGLPQSPRGVDNHLILCSVNGRLMVLPASEVFDVRSDIGEMERFEVSDGETFNGCIEAELSLDGSVFHLLNPEQLLLEQEQIRLEEFRNIEQTRIADCLER